MERFGGAPDTGLVSESVLIVRLREANRNLLRAALSARDSLAVAESALSNQDRFFSVLAHELRSPLAPIKLVASALEMLPGSLEGVPRLHQTLTRQLDSLVHLVNSLDDVARIKNGKLALDMHVLPVADAILAALEMARPLSEARQQQLTFRLPEEQLLVHGDHERLVQVFSNLLSNAVKFTPAHGAISVAIHRRDDSVYVEIQDSGPGITPAFLPFMFDMFTQDGAPQTHSRAGSGIGLSLVRTLVELHGGTVAIGSVPQAGCRATVMLPLISAPHGSM